MARKARTGNKAKSERKKPKGATVPAGNGVMNLIKELWQAAVNLRGSIEAPDYKRYVLPLIFFRFLSLRYERRWVTGKVARQR